MIFYIYHSQSLTHTHWVICSDFAVRWFSRGLTSTFGRVAEAEGEAVWWGGGAAGSRGAALQHLLPAWGAGHIDQFGAYQSNSVCSTQTNHRTVSDLVEI